MNNPSRYYFSNKIILKTTNNNNGYNHYEVTFGPVSKSIVSTNLLHITDLVDNEFLNKYNEATRNDCGIFLPHLHLKDYIGGSDVIKRTYFPIKLDILPKDYRDIETVLAYDIHEWEDKVKHRKIIVSSVTGKRRIYNLPKNEASSLLRKLRHSLCEYYIQLESNGLGKIKDFKPLTPIVYANAIMIPMYR